MDLFDYQDGFSEAVNGEKLIGSTVIDLEAALGSWQALLGRTGGTPAWRDAMDRKQQIPTENRALINPQLAGQNCGSHSEMNSPAVVARYRDVGGDDRQRACIRHQGPRWQLTY